MRHILRLIFVSTGLLIYISLIIANPVDTLTARNSADNFFYRNHENYVKSATLPYSTLVYSCQGTNLKSTENSAVYYVYNYSAGGFIILSGYDNVYPVLGYSFKGSYSTGKQSPAFKSWMENCKNQIEYVVNNNLPATPEIKQRWADLVSDQKILILNSPQAVTPLVQTVWDQEPYYNDLCPYDNTQKARTVTGCVATAMAQVMKFWNYPLTGTGFNSYNSGSYGTLSANFGATTYDWAAMPDSVASPNLAVATLMYQCGVSVDMDYGVDGSSAATLDVAGALKTYFGYDTNTVAGINRSDYTDSAWTATIKAELLAGRPVQYAGTSSEGGHSFVCDGMDVNNYFHFNWGWSGISDGYYELNALNPGTQGTGGGSEGYNTDQRAIIGVQPAVVDTSKNIKLQLSVNVTAADSTINYGDTIMIFANVRNIGSSSFTGDFTAAIFDTSNVFVTYISNITGLTLAAGDTFKSCLSFVNGNLMTVLPGTYTIYIYYRPAGGKWVTLSASSGITDSVVVQVTNIEPITLNSPITILQGLNNIVQGSPITVNVDVLNSSGSTFSGDFDVALYDVNGYFVSDIQTLTGLVLLNGKHFTNGLTFTVDSLNVPSGSYLLALTDSDNINDYWQFTGSSGSYINPIEIIVKDSTLKPDIYEPDNTSQQAYNLQYTFVNDSAMISTPGANFNTGDEFDYYKVELPGGYNYSISAQVWDSNNEPTKGINYTVDALFSYTTDTNNWSESTDGVLGQCIDLTGPDTLYFLVVPYNQGQTGTYMLQLNVNRYVPSAIDQVTKNEDMDIYPVPANDYINIAFNDYPASEIILAEETGKIISITNNEQLQDNISIDLEGYPNGIYFIRLINNDQVITRKFIIVR